MGIQILDNGISRKLEDVELVEKVIELRRKKDPWAVIHLMTIAWANKAPDEVDALMIGIKDYREDLVDPKYGQTKGGKDLERRFTLSFPKTLMRMIRTIYNSEELPMDAAFFKKFGEKYPSFRIAQKG